LHEFTNAPHRDVEKRPFRVIHPYHPLFQEEFELLACRQNWGEDRVWFQDRSGRLHSVPASWTDAAAIDAFVIVAAGRSLFRVADLLELVQLIQDLESEKADGLSSERCHGRKGNDVKEETTDGGHVAAEDVAIPGKSRSKRILYGQENT
jgi:Family of unknown function (DUF5372)